MKTIEELEALVETVTRERDLSLFAWEAAGMQGRDAQSAMLELARQLEEARQDLDAVNAVLEDINWLEDERDKARAWAHQSERERDEAREAIVALTTAKAEADLEIATLTAALDERDVEAERGLEQYDRLVRERDDLKKRLLDMVFERNDMRDKLDICTLDLVTAKRERDEARADAEYLMHERDELLVRVANQEAELRATREAYNEARAELTRERIGVRPVDEVRSDAYRRGAEAMREACARGLDRLLTEKKATAIWVSPDEILALPIPEEP